MKFNEWTQKNINYINNNYNNNTIIQNNKNNFYSSSNNTNNAVDKCYIRNPSKKIMPIIRDFNGNGNRHISIQKKPFKDIAHSNNKDKICKIKKKKNKTIDKTKNDIDNTNNFVKREKIYKMNKEI